MKTKSVRAYCPQCLSETAGILSVEDNNLYLTVDCPTHGTLKNLFFKKYEIYKKIENTVNNQPLIKDKLTIQDIINNITTIHISITERCNLNCAACFASNEHKNQDISLDLIKEKLTPFIKFKKKPMIVLIGGEPTLDPELPDKIRWLSDNGFIVRLSTNGITLTDFDYYKKLKAAGLHWLLLQFDALDREVSIKFRGKDLIDMKLKVLEYSQVLGINVHLIQMVSKDINLEEIPKIFDLIRKYKCIKAYNIYPASDVGRNLFGSTHLNEIFEELSKVGITIRDVLHMKTILGLLYKLTKKAIFKQKICSYPLLVYFTEKKQYPITRMLNPLFFLKNIKNCMNIVFNINKIFNFDRNPSENILYMNIEKFYDRECIIKESVFNCHNCFLTENGFELFCVYNLFSRSSRC